MQSNSRVAGGLIRHFACLLDLYLCVIYLIFGPEGSKTLKNIFEAHNLKRPEDFEQDRSVDNKFIWKPLYGSGGCGISLKAKSELSHYKQKYLPGKTFSISFICNKRCSYSHTLINWSVK